MAVVARGPGDRGRSGIAGTPMAVLEDDRGISGSAGTPMDGVADRGVSGSVGRSTVISLEEVLGAGGTEELWLVLGRLSDGTSSLRTEANGGTVIGGWGVRAGAVAVGRLWGKFMTGTSAGMGAGIAAIG